VTECSTKWLGALEIGFTSCNPFSLSGVLPNDFSGRTSLCSGYSSVLKVSPQVSIPINSHISLYFFYYFVVLFYLCQQI
jgi:hypothetical protein